jgi:hypothetical protein
MLSPLMASIVQVVNAANLKITLDLRTKETKEILFQNILQDNHN